MESDCKSLLLWSYALCSGFLIIISDYPELLQLTFHERHDSIPNLVPEHVVACIVNCVSLLLLLNSGCLHKVCASTDVPRGCSPVAPQTTKQCVREHCACHPTSPRAESAVGGIRMRQDSPSVVHHGSVQIRCNTAPHAATSASPCLPAQGRRRR